MIFGVLRLRPVLKLMLYKNLCFRVLTSLTLSWSQMSLFTLLPRTLCITLDLINRTMEV